MQFEVTKSEPSTLQEVRQVQGNALIESIGELLEAKTGLMLTQMKLNMATSIKDLKLDNAEELKSDIVSLKANGENNAEELKSDIVNNAKELKSDIVALKANVENNAEKLESDIATLKTDVENNAKELKSDMATVIKTSHNEIMNCVEVIQVEKLTAAILGSSSKH